MKVALCCLLCAVACGPPDRPEANGGAGGGGGGGGGEFADAALSDDDPETCDHAATAHTYVGCDFWPTVLPNIVGRHFDYAVVVANTGDRPAGIEIERDGQLVETGEVAPGGLTKFFLPWTESKQYDGACDTDSTVGLDSSRRYARDAYHLRSSRPVTVFQFNPIEYRGAGGPPGKDWSACEQGCIFGCKSYTNDASLLLPSTALTANYRVTSMSGIDTDEIRFPGYFAVTGLEDGTDVAVRLGPDASAIAGDGVPASGPGEIFHLTVDQGDVAVVVGTPATDLAGTQVQGSRPIQVMAGMPCTYLPSDRQACDHLEETVLPAETLGTRYLVSPPTAPGGDTRGHLVRLYGNVDGTTLSYAPSAPPGAPATIDAGQMVDLGVVQHSFQVTGDHELAVATFMLGSSMVDSDIFASRGDPSQTNQVPVEQYRKKYVFLAPDDYDVSFADIIVPEGASVTLDGAPVTATPEPIAAGYSVLRVRLGPGQSGAHLLESDQYVGLQVMGYGFATSYHYPGGLHLRGIAPPPPVID